MAVDILQDKIRKIKNPTMLELALPLEDMPPEFERDAAGYCAFCRSALDGLKDQIPAARISFAAFALLGLDGIKAMIDILQYASESGYYTVLDAPEIASPMMAKQIAESILGENSQFSCDGLIISGYAGSDIIKPFLPYCKKGKKDIFVIARTANKSAPEIQDLLAGSRLVHAAAADHVNRYGADTEGKHGYTRVGVLAAASSAESLRALRSKYPKLFLLLDGYDYPNSNAKNCSQAFDKFGHGAVVCSGAGITCAWKQADSDGSDWLSHAVAAAERVKKNVTRYITIL